MFTEGEQRSPVFESIHTIAVLAFSVIKVAWMVGNWQLENVQLWELWTGKHWEVWRVKCWELWRVKCWEVWRVKYWKCRK